MTVATTDATPVLGQFTIGQGDTLVVKLAPSAMATWQATALARSVKDWLVAKGADAGITVLVIPPDGDVAALPQDEMRRLGWVRAGSERTAAVEDFAHYLSNKLASEYRIALSAFEELAADYLAT